jgi:hypothetical protein
MKLKSIVPIEWRVITKNFSGLGSVNELIPECAAARPTKPQRRDHKSFKYNAWTSDFRREKR